MIISLSIEKTGIAILGTTLILLLLVIAYRKLLAYFRKDHLPKEKYCVLYRIEKNPAEGELEFYFTLEEKKHVDFDFLNDNFESLLSLASKEFEKGGHILRLDSRNYQNGTYYYQLKTDNQKTYKKLEILN